MKKLGFLLAFLLVFIGSWLVFSPYFPAVIRSFDRVSNKVTVDEVSVDMGLRSVLRADLYEKMQGKNYLVIPKIGLVKEIFEGNEESILDKGVWIRPVSEHPFRSGNTVLAGHRYTNAFDENVFYDLDKISKGDVIWAKWADSERKYVVSEVKIVSAETVEIESQTSEEILTVYTCEPLYTAEKRMVLIAKPVD